MHETTCVIPKFLSLPLSSPEFSPSRISKKKEWLSQNWREIIEFLDRNFNKIVCLITFCYEMFSHQANFNEIFGRKMRKSLTISPANTPCILPYRDFWKSWRQNQKVGLKWYKSGVNENPVNSDFQVKYTEQPSVCSHWSSGLFGTARADKLIRNGPCQEKTCLPCLGTTEVQTSLRICADWSAPLLFAYWKVSYLDLLWAKFSNSPL